MLHTRLHVVVCFGTSLFITFLSAVARADTDFTSGTQSYRLVTTARTWDNAEADAVAKGGHLVRIDSAAENTAVLTAITSLVTTTAADGGGTRYAWIGGKETVEGTYAWVGSLTSPYWAGGTGGSAQGGLYQNWGRLGSPYGGPEPDNYQGTQTRAAMAVAMWPSFAPAGSQIGNAGQWNDISGTSNFLYYVIEWSPWQFWQKNQFTGTNLTNAAISGPDANPDGDAMTNLLEFAFGTSATQCNSATVAENAGTIVSLGSPAVRIVGGQWQMIFARRKQFAAEGIQYTAQFSTGLGSWTDATATPAVVADNGTMQIVSLAFPVVGGVQTRFSRLRVILPSS